MIRPKQIFDIRETAEILVPDKLGRTSYYISLAVIALMVITILLIYPRLPSIVPLYFTLPWGEARLASKIMLFLLPGVSMIIFILNIILGKIAAKLSPLLPRVLAVTAAVVTVMMQVALIGIVQSLIL